MQIRHKKIFMKSFQNLATYKTEFTHSVDESGIESCTVSDKTHIKWIGYQGGLRFQDGYLLRNIYNQYQWFPDPFLETGSLDEFENLLLQSNIPITYKN